MPTIRIFSDDEIQFVSENGDVLARQVFDFNTSTVSFEDDQGNLLPVQLGSQSIQSLSTAEITDLDDGTTYDLGDDLAKGAFTDSDSDGVYTLPQPSDSINIDTIETSSVTDTSDGTTYDVGDDLAKGAFTDSDSDGVYTLPQPSDSINIDTVETSSVTDTSDGTTYDVGDDLAVSAEIYFQQTEPAETPQPAPAGGGGLWYEPITISAGSRRFGPIALGDAYDNNLIGTSDNVFIVGADLSLYGLSTSGTELWEKSGFFNLPRTVGADDTNFYFANGDAAIALEARTGNVVWNQPSVGQEVDFGKSVPVTDGAVLFGIAADLYSVDTSDGGILWNSFVDTAHPLGGADGKFVVNTGFEELTAFNANTGTVEWTAAFDNPLSGSPNDNGFTIADGKAVFVAPSRNIHAYDLATGDELWKQAELETPDTTPGAPVAVANGVVGVLAVPDDGSTQGVFHAYDLSDGAPLYDFTKDTGSFGDQNLTSVKDRFVIVDEIDTRGVEAQTGDTLFSVTNDYSTFSRIAISDDETLGFGNNNFATDGFEVLDQSSYSTPRVSDGTNWIGKR